MTTIDKVYINGEFVTPHGTQRFDLISPVTNQKTGEAVLGDEVDTQNAIAAAKDAYKTFSKTTKEERISYLEKLRAIVSRREKDLTNVMVEEYGGTFQFCSMVSQNMVSDFSAMIDVLKNFDFEQTVGNSKVYLQPVGVVGIIIPWNMSNGFIVTKLSTAIAAGCTVVVKPSEMSTQQTQIIAECFHEAGLPKGVINFVNGLGDVVGAELTGNTNVSKIAFTGSTAVGKIIAKGAVDSMKRVTLELGGKSPNVILDDANLQEAIPTAIFAAYLNSGQACAAATRLLVPESKLEEVNAIAKAVIQNIKVGNPKDVDTVVGPMVNKKQYERVQDYIRIGQQEGATLLVGGEGKPEGLEDGNYVKATIFTNVKNDMRIAQEEIFGPVLSIIPYKDEEDAIAIANDTSYGLAAYVSSASKERAYHVASQIDAGRICINGISHDSKAPFGGFKQSGIGREYGIFGLEEYLEPKAILE
ncbi:aldehyde dehydrogenase family protein [Flavobacterium sp. AC]|uniref:aldehyde dehydrogenase (NAD(+)) n=1 Tax=Flavobacterium azizsancarii TaxID=2961580 RepID=A0ABT4W769_9FLAO|nr:aldehyde dehydrogenase family protein [Flavobacterium azizsancarii]MDA6068383.1 aldehyde dehydrogenase family protein [Flavobacterium azizsancarii]